MRPGIFVHHLYDHYNMPDGYDKSFWNGGDAMKKVQETDPSGGKSVVEVTQNYAISQGSTYKTD